VKASFRARVERKQDDLPRYVVLPSAAVKQLGLRERVTVEGTVAGVPLGRRSIHPWGDGRWFLIVAQADCRQGGFDTGDTGEFDVRVVGDELPEELSRFLARDRRAKALWEELPPGQRRQIAEDVRRAKRPETRERRATAWPARFG
jgi:hypothetical protein